VVADRGSASITVIDVKSDTPTTFAVPDNGEPMYVAYSATYNRVFVGDRANDRVVVFSADDFSIETTVATGAGVFHMWASDMNDQLWVNNDIDNTITIIDTVTLDVIDTVLAPADLVDLGGKLHDVIIDPILPFAYATMIGVAGANDYVVKYSTQTFGEVDRQAVGKDPHVSLSRQSRLLYLPCQNSNEVFVLDRDTFDLQPGIAIPAAHGAWMSRNGQSFFTTNIAGGGVDGVFEIDTGINDFIDHWDTPFATPHNIATTPNGKKLYVTHSGATSDKVSVYSRQNKHTPFILISTVDTGTNPFGLFYVP
jgi:DNA-binding beta-propeller fold protein YncE